MLLLMRPLSTYHRDFLEYIEELLLLGGVNYRTLGAQRPLKSSPGFLSSIARVKFVVVDIERTMAAAFGRNVFFLFPDLFTCLAVLAKLTFQPDKEIYLYIHEPRIVINGKLSSRIKSVLYSWLIKRTNQIGPDSSNPIHLLHLQQDVKIRNVSAAVNQTVLFMGNWLEGKVSSDLIHVVRQLKERGNRCVRLGYTEEKKFLTEFDEVIDMVFSNETKEDWLRKVDFLYLPYVPTSQSGVIADCLSYKVRCICSDAFRYEHFYLGGICTHLGILDQSSDVNFDAIWDEVHKNNLNSTKAIWRTSCEN